MSGERVLSDGEEKLLIAVDCAELPGEALRHLWHLIVDVAARHSPDEISIEGPTVERDIPLEVQHAQRHLLEEAPAESRHRDRVERRWQWRRLGPRSLGDVKIVGPRVLGLNIYHSGTFLAGIPDYGLSISLVATISQWTDLAATVERQLGSLPPHDIESGLGT